MFICVHLRLFFFRCYARLLSDFYSPDAPIEMKAREEQRSPYGFIDNGKEVLWER